MVLKMNIILVTSVVMGIILFFLITIPFFALFVLMLSINLSSTNMIAWGLVFIPIWILFFCWFLYILYLLWVRSRKREEKIKIGNDESKGVLWFNIVSMTILLADSILMCLTLQSNSNGDLNSGLLIATFAVFWLFMVIFAIYGLNCGPGKKRCCTCLNPCSESDIIIGAIIWFSVIAFSILLLINILSTESIYWSLVFIPIWVGFVAWFTAIICCLYKKLYGSGSNRYRSVMTVEILYHFFIFIGILIFFILLNVELVTTDSIGAIGLLYPIIILLVLLFCIAYAIDWTSINGLRGYNTVVSPEDWTEL